MKKGSFEYPIDIGVLGGMGPRATNYFIGELLNSVEEIHHPENDQSYPNILVRYASYLPDRSESLKRGEVNKLAIIMENEIKILVDFGCPLIAIPCISAFMIANNLMNKYPIMDIPGIVRKRVESINHDVIIGIISTTGAKDSGVIDYFLDEHRRVEYLLAEEQQLLMEFVYGGAKTWRLTNDMSILFQIITSIEKRGCEYIVAGCTEVEMCLASATNNEKKYIFPLKLATEYFASNWKGGKNDRA